MINRPGTLSRFATRGLAIIGITGLLAASVAVPVVGRQPVEQRAPSSDQRVAGFRTLDRLPSLPAPSRKPTASSKLDAAMTAISNAGTTESTTVASAARANAVRFEGGRVQTRLMIADGSLAGVERAIREAGGKVTSSSNGLVQAWLQPASLAHIAGLAAVRGITKPQAPILLEGDSLTEGLAAMTNSGDWHTAGFDGSGVKVAVIDGGFTGYPSRVTSGDLPNTLVPKNTCDSQPDPGGTNGGTPHGTAVAEIVHDVAPGALLWLIKVCTDIDLAQAVNYAIAQDVDIITTSLGWFGVTSGDGTGFFDEQVDEARAAGILWTTAAGNSREAYYDGAFSDGNNDGAHQFSGDWEVNIFGGATATTCAALPPGNAINAILTWNDWLNVNKDFDLYLYRLNAAGEWNEIASSENDQAGDFPTPYEEVFSATTGANTCYAYAISHYAGGSNAALRVHSPNFFKPKFFDNARSLSNLADAPAAVTIAALDVETAGYPQESYSSEGPRMGPGGAIAGGAIGMDLSAYANVDTEAYGPNTFNGTSSATPHVAGAFALAKDANPSFTLAQLETFLNGRAQDKGVAGQDPLYGFGRLRLGAPPAPPSAQQPDGWIRVGAGADVGNNIYNLTAVGQSKSKKSAAGSTITFNITVQNDGIASDTFDLQGGSNATGYTVKYFAGATDITASVVAGTYTTPSVAPGASYPITVTVKVKGTAAAGSKVARIVTITSNVDSLKKDAVKFTGKRA